MTVYDKLAIMPPPTAKQSIQRRTVVNPLERIATLSPEQLEMFNQAVAYVTPSLGLMEVFNTEPEPVEMLCFEGFAGTGKSYLVATLVEHLLANTRNVIAMTATTNKAVKVLKQQATYDHPSLSFSTIHSLLGLKEQIDSYTGKQKFVQINRDHSKLNEQNILILDEASMLSDELFDYIEPYVATGDLRVIFVGDPCQIPPVGMEDSIPFRETGRKKYKIKVLRLQNIIRQAEGNPIIAATMKLRKALGRDTVFPIKEDGYDPETMDGIYWLRAEHKLVAKELLRTYFCSENFKQDADFAKVICWTNKSVDGFNDLIRAMLYGKEVGRLVIGEKLIANKPIIDKNELNEKVIVFNNNDEFEVLDYTVSVGGYKGTDLKFYDVKVEYVGISGNVDTKRIKIIHEDSYIPYLEILEHLTEVAKGCKKGSYEAANAWKDFYQFTEVFADVNYNYALTAHKAQGSTYQNTFVVESDLDNNRKVIERNRIKYTAFSRPSKKLFVIC